RSASFLISHAPRVHLWPYRAGRRLTGTSDSALAIHLRHPPSPRLRRPRGCGGQEASAERARPLRFRQRCARLLRRRRPPSEDRDRRGPAMEETMTFWSISELMHLTRDELCNLAARISRLLPEF